MSVTEDRDGSLIACVASDVSLVCSVCKVTDGLGGGRFLLLSACLVIEFE